MCHANEKERKKERDEIFDITVRKGVAACIPNAYLLYPDGLTAEEAEFVSFVGSMGQNLNDVEGIFEDMEEKSLTPALISFLRHNDTLDRFFDKFTSYLRRLMNNATKNFPGLPLDRVLISLSICANAALVNHRSFARKKSCGRSVEGVRSRF